jgi:hypothetical protein
MIAVHRTDHAAAAPLLRPCAPEIMGKIGISTILNMFNNEAIILCMLPTLRGIIARRVLLNFRADPHVAQSVLPEPFVVETYNGAAIVGICLIRLEQLRPKGFPSRVSMASENVAHRIAVRYPVKGGMRSGVFIWRRETDQKLVQMFGGRLFPGVHHGATFSVQENDGQISMDVKSDDGETDVSFSATTTTSWQPTSAFKSLDEASEFFQHGDCGFSCSLDQRSVEGMELKISQWSVKPLTVQLKNAAFYSRSSRFPKGSVEFDCGLLMRAVPHEWHQIKDISVLNIASLLP